MSARDLKKESFWRGLVRAPAGSGVTVRAWCRRRRVEEGGFYWWRKELARRDAEASVHPDAERPVSAQRSTKKQPVSFVPVQVVADDREAEGGRIEIVLAGGQCIRVSGRVDRRALADVLAVMASAPGTFSAMSEMERCAAEGQPC